MSRWVVYYVVFPMLFGGFLYTNTTYQWSAAAATQDKQEIKENLKEVKEDLKARIDRLDQRTQATLSEIKDLLRPSGHQPPSPEDAD